MSTSKQRDNSRTTAATATRAGRQAGPDAAQSKQADRSADFPQDSIARKANEEAVFQRLHDLIITALEDMKARDVQEVDVRGKSDVTDLMVVASGTSSRHVRSIAEEVVIKGKQAGMLPIGIEGEDEGDWVLVDMGDIVVHVMQPRIRELYALERLWDVANEVPGDSAAAS